jgi:hypothetical protein
MKLVALMPARNEDWVIGLSLRAALKWCDEIIVLDHASIDRTGEIINEAQAEFAGRVTALRSNDEEWLEMGHRQLLLETARRRGATHCALVDADEVLTGNLLESIRTLVAALGPSQLLQIPMRNMHRSIHEHRSDRSAFGHAITTVAFGVSDALSWRDASGYPHHHREPYGSTSVHRIYPGQMDGGVMHLQFASWRRLLAKHALYKASERLRFPEKPVAEIDRMYSLAPDETGLETTPAKFDWLGPHESEMKYLDLKAEPWQEAETRRLVAAYGRAAFDGLDLFGIV